MTSSGRAAPRLLRGQRPQFVTTGALSAAADRLQRLPRSRYGVGRKLAEVVMSRLGVVAGLVLVVLATSAADAQRRRERERPGPQGQFEVEQVAITAGRLVTPAEPRGPIR
jgi:heme O synthase-like polyprenyltransferase